MEPLPRDGRGVSIPLAVEEVGKALADYEYGRCSVVVDVEVVEKALADYRKKKGTKPSYASKEIDETELENPGVVVDRRISAGLAEARPSYTYDLIKNLVDIEVNPIYSKALEEWSRLETLLERRLERAQKKVGNLKNEVYQLIGFFSVFQILLLTTVSQSNLLHCNNLWSPIVLSLAASALTVVGVTLKLKRITRYKKYIYEEKFSQKVVMRRSNYLRSVGLYKFTFEDDSEIIRRKPPYPSVRTYQFAIIISLVTFAAVFPISHWRIACYPGPDPYAEE